VPRDQLIEQILDQLQLLATEVDHLTGVAAAHDRLNRTDLRALQVLRAGGGLTAGALAGALNVTSGATTRVIDGLVRNGHVVRQADRRDRRRVLVRLTESAAQLVDDTYAELRAEVRAHLHPYGDSELETLARFLAQASSLMGDHARRLAAPRAP
jgi:DNA-binding MarR family transcriptional regulator